ncbi:MAG: hypothetical protein VB997_11175 [Opitutales bacterium]
MASLLLLFVFRIVAQFAQWIHPVGFLPAFDDWHSGVLPYPVLLTGQALVLAVLLRIVVTHGTDRCIARRRLGIVLLTGGGVYLAVMCFRLLASVTFATADSWLGATIPAFFHVVLACFLLIHGHFNLRHATHYG